jgi:hypothetical protein
MLFSACDQKQHEVKNASSIAKSQEVISVKAPKVDVKPDCLPSTGNAAEDSEVTMCYYNTESLEQAFLAIACSRKLCLTKAYKISLMIMKLGLNTPGQIESMSQ